MGGHIQKELQSMSFVILQSEKWSDPRKVIVCRQLLIVSVGTEFVQFHLCPEASYSLLKNKNWLKKCNCIMFAGRRQKI